MTSSISVVKICNVISWLSCLWYFTWIFIKNRRDMGYALIWDIATNHSADIDYKDFMKIYRKCTNEPYSFLTIDTTLPANNSLRFRKNLLDPL